MILPGAGRRSQDRREDHVWSRGLWSSVPGAVAVGGGGLLLVLFVVRYWLAAPMEYSNKKAKGREGRSKTVCQRASGRVQLIQPCRKERTPGRAVVCRECQVVKPWAADKGRVKEGEG